MKNYDTAVAALGDNGMRLYWTEKLMEAGYHVPPMIHPSAVVTFEQEVISFMTDSRETAGGSLIILDLDDFKKINDNYGHLVGDRALKILTDTLMATFRRRDIIGRLGGDEFLVFIKSVTSREILDKRMKELFVSLAQTEELNLTCSVGICIMEREGFSYEEGLKKADTALYKSKKEGKNRYSYYEETRLSES